MNIEKHSISALSNAPPTLLLYGFTVALTDYSPFDCLVNPPPLGVVSLRLEPSTSSFGLLGNIDGASVDDVATFSRSQCGIDQLLVFLTASSIGARQRLPCSHHHLQIEVIF